MKKFILIITLLFVASTVFAANFAPTVMKMSAASAIKYDFGGAKLDIPVKVTGTPAMAIFLVYTKDQANGINNVVNGYLGWHTVNKIDTCIYASSAQQLAVGSNTISWSGKDQDGKVVPKGTYTYYIWAYDNVTAKVFACPVLTPNMGRNSNIYTRDFKGNKLAKPLVYGSPTKNSEDTGDQGEVEVRWVRQKWILGSDPLDTTLYETTQFLGYQDMCTYSQSPYVADDYFDFSTSNNLLGHVRKWKWVPNGDSVKDTNFGDSGEFTYGINTGTGWWVTLQDMRYVGGDLLAATNTDHSGVSTEAELVMISSLDGTEQFRIDLSKWWVHLSDGEKGGQAASGPNKFDVRGDNVFLGAHSTCMNQVVVPTAGENEEDWNRWVNGNGDYTGDHNFEADAERPWVCHDYNVGPYKYQIKSDANLFSAFPSFDMGAVSFGLYAPDGTGLGYHAYAGESAGGKLSSSFVDDDTPYDGMYSDFVSSGGTDAPWGGPAGYFFVAHDSIKGVISSEVGVDEAGPAAFAVDQNSPNPFNPTTTINITVPEAGTVAIDVYNVAGQKVDTLANEFMGAGKHSVTWDATGFSAGVYFYTVKTGNLTRTMKMTLLK
ncbi:T9SS type A sorting domain-containing protein [bacterium]|nr:T9SS type A sorting domain-containing protein [bacterium]